MTDVAAPVFDDVDIFFIANTLTTPQLRHEIWQAELKASLADTYKGTEFEGDSDSFPWVDYADICREALKWQHNSRAKVQPVLGHVDVESLKANNDILDVIDCYTELRPSGRNFTGRCPIHEDKHPSMTVYPDQQTFHCYGCNKGGDIIAFIMAVENVDFRGATAILGGR